MKAENVIRKRVPIKNEKGIEENYYLIVGKTSVMATCPFENRPENRQHRLAVESLCEAISGVLERINKNDEQLGKT